MFRLFAASLVLMGSSASLAAQGIPESTALPKVLRLEEALRLLDGRGLDLLVAEAAVQSAEGDWTAAGAIPNPLVSGSLGKSFTYGNCTDSTGRQISCGVLPSAQYGLGISDQGALFDTLFGKRALRRQTAMRALEAARASRDDARRTLTTQVKQAYLQVVIAQEAVVSSREIAATNDRTHELMKTRYEAGAISEADLARVDVARLEAEQAVTAAAQTLQDARAALAFLLGVRGITPDYEVVAPELLRMTIPPGLERGGTEATKSTLLARAREHRPDLLAAQRQRERAVSALALARRQRWPDIALSVNYAQEGTTNDAISPPTITVGASLPLPIFYRQEGEIVKAEADLRAQELQLAKLEAQISSEIERGLIDFTAATQLASRMEESLLERARRARDLVNIQYRKGAASLLDLLDAQRTFIATSVEYRQDLALYWGATFNLEQAVGGALR